MNITDALRAARAKKPLVQCITNVVTVNDCANIILAAGGTPTMAHIREEAAEAVRAASALVTNLGAAEYIDSMVLAGKEANRLGIPVVFDPVACGATEFRRNASRRLLSGVHFQVIRGNVSEIRALAEGQGARGSGVDASAGDAVTAESLPRVVEAARSLALSTGAVVAVSGAEDVITDGRKTVVVKNGCAVMARITGSGCMLSSLCGTFAGALPEDPFRAALTAFTVMGVAGERADQARLRKGTGNATFRTDLIDAVFCMTEEDLLKEARYEIYEG